MIMTPYDINVMVLAFLMTVVLPFIINPHR